MTEIVMPRAGLTMTEGTITEWKAAEGAQVGKGDVLMEFENEKNVIPCEALSSGILHIAAAVDDTVEVGGLIGYLAETKEEYNSLLGGKAPEKESTPAAAPAKSPAQETPSKPLPARVRATGYAKKLAAAAGIELSTVKPSGGPDGLRIVARDVQNHKPSPKTVPAVSIAGSTKDEITETAWTGVRKTIAKNMFTSLQNSAQTTSICEMDATELLALRRKLVDQQELLGTKITVNDLLCRLMAKVAVRHPLINATFDGKTLYSHSHVQMNVAVGAENGLMVPVVRNMDTLGIAEISKAIKDIAARAKTGKLTPDEQSGGTFTVTNVGMFPIDMATPVINPPQTAIVGMGRTVKKPVVMPDGSFAARDMMYIFLTFDHRVIDGLEAGRFFADVEKYFKCPELILA